MEIYPAVDLYEGRVVRLERGDYQKCTDYSEDPAQMARKWSEEGARWLHVVDLEGSKNGEIKNWKSLQDILSATRISVEFGGGVRTEKDIQRLLDLGVKRVILGTKVLEPDFLERVTSAWAGKVALSLDLRGEEIQVQGWLRGGGKAIFDLFDELKDFRIACLIVTDIEKDGTLTGMNLSKMKRVVERSPFPIILSGGVSSMEDLVALSSFQEEKEGERLEGVIIGKALYEGRIHLREAFRKVRKP